MSCQHRGLMRLVALATVAVMVTGACSDGNGTADTVPSQSGDDTPTTTIAPPATTEPAALPNYEIVSEEDLSFLGATRISLRVTVEAGTSPDQIREVAHHLADLYRESHQYQAFNIFFYHYPELAYDVASLGIWEDAPFGDWGRAAEASRGDYSTFEIDDSIFEKDWSLLPSQRDITIYQAFKSMFDLLDTDPLGFPDDDDVATAVAEDLGVSVHDVFAALNTVLTWQFSGR